VVVWPPELWYISFNLGWKGEESGESRPVGLTFSHVEQIEDFPFRILLVTSIVILIGQLSSHAIELQSKAADLH